MPAFRVKYRDGAVAVLHADSAAAARAKARQLQKSGHGHQSPIASVKGECGRAHPTEGVKCVEPKGHSGSHFNPKTGQYSATGHVPQGR